jgi:uncharacterized OB-fold protein
VHFPAPVCPGCGSEQLAEEQVPTGTDRGVLEAFTVVHRVFVPGFEDRAPYAVGWVGLDLQPGLRVFAGLVGVSPDQLRTGQRLRPVATAGPDGEPVTCYTPDDPLDDPPAHTEAP